MATPNLHAFEPEGAGLSVKRAATSTAARATVRAVYGTGRTMSITNLGTNKVFVRPGDSTVVAVVDVDYVIPAGATRVIQSLSTHLSAVCDAAETGTLYITPGNGGV